MAKPDITLARWATDISNNTAPSSGQRDTGWVSGAVVVSSYFNELQLEYYKWLQYLDGGALTGNFSVTGTLKRGASVPRHIPVTTAVEVVDVPMEYNATRFVPQCDGATSRVQIPIPMELGERLTAVTIRTVAGDVDTMALKVYRIDASGSSTITRTQLGSTATSGSEANVAKTTTVSGLTETCAANYTYIAEITFASFVGGYELNACYVSTDFPP